MKIKQYEMWFADLNPRFGTETGKTRPAVIIQTNLLNKYHPSTIVCPITTNVKPESEILRVHLNKVDANLKEDYDIMIGQICAIDNKRLLKKIGQLDNNEVELIRSNLSVILDL